MIRSLRKLWPPGIRLQVLCWYTGIFTLVLLLAGAASYHYIENALENSVDSSLRVQAQQVAREIDTDHNTITIHDTAGILSNLSYNEQPAQKSDPNDGPIVRLLDPQGNILQATAASRDLRIPTASIALSMQCQDWEGTTHTTDEKEVQLYSQVFAEHGKILAIIQVGLSLTSQGTLLHQLVILLLVVGALALVVCALSSYWLTARSFRPIQQLIQTARHIKAGDVHQRVPLPQSHDEIQYLALTLNEMLDSLEETVTRQQRFVADASHELRTPVAVIRNKTSIALLQPQTWQDYAAVLQEINTEAERLGHLISDLLALARGDEGKAPFEKETIRLDLLTQATVNSTRFLAEEREIELTIQAEQPVTLIGDEARLIQVVLNLVENALRYTNPGGKVLVTVEAQEYTACLVIQDTGIGIDAQHLPHIFERFYRVDPARQLTDNNSSGLGLAIVEWIVRIHGGSINVTSQPGKGSTFTVLLPLPGRPQIKPKDTKKKFP